MKELILLVLALTSINVFCQDSNYQKSKELYIYNTYEDFKNKKDVYLGQISNFSWSSWGKNKLCAIINSKEVKVNINKYWGFRLDDVFFRINKSSPRIPVLILGSSEKIFYIDGYFYLGEILSGSSSSSRTTNALFYSDDFESKIIHIDKLPKYEKNNQSLSEIINCINKGKKRYGYQAKFNSYYKCIDRFLND
ncbi:hypothetical protein ACGK9U_09940 [Mariniflexile sp. HNIBRBA6329]|uniref:hypothetical protein n=1 Tax=Mariniflexile sp. HNIBRBA6329 TaxID=3373088 RepID=UPI0037456591